MKSGRLLTIVFMVVVLAGCSGAKTSAPSSSSSTQGSPSATSDAPSTQASPSSTKAAPSTKAPKHAPALDGVYRLDFDLKKQTRNGARYDGAPFALQYAFKSTCDGDKCVAVGRQLRDDDPEEPVDDRPVVVLDFDDDGKWVTTTAGKSSCGGGEAPVLQSWSLEPGDDGKLTGTRRLAFFSADCSGAYEQPMTAIKTGNVDAELSMPDPAKEQPLKASPAEGFRGHYTKSLTAQDGKNVADVDIDVSTTCIRNVARCLTYAAYTSPGGRDRSVRAYQFEGTTWKGEAKSRSRCASGAEVTETTYSEWALPEVAGDPLKQLTGTQRESFPAPCEATVATDILFDRIGD